MIRYGGKVVAGVEFSSQQMVRAGTIRLADKDRVKVIGGRNGDRTHLGKFGRIEGHCRLGKFKVRLDDGIFANFEAYYLEKIKTQAEV